MTNERHCPSFVIRASSFVIPNLWALVIGIWSFKTDIRNYKDSPMPFGFGIIGCGMIANFHAKAIADIREAKLVACFDMFPAAADKLAAATGCKPYHQL